jgi:hypothetical protein
MIDKFADLTGMQFGRLIVIGKYSENLNHTAIWKCKCNCGNKDDVFASGYNLRSGKIKSCKCLKREQASKNAKEYCKKYNEYKIFGEYSIIYMENNKEVILDTEDLENALKYWWFVHNGYAITKIYDENKSCVDLALHILVFGKKNGFQIDHIDRDRLNCRKYNLRYSNTVEQCQNRSLKSTNTSGVTGVGFDKRYNKWYARICVYKNEKNLGYYNNFKDAVIARLKAEKEYFSEFAPQQHLYEQYGIIANKDNEIL